MSAFAGTPTRNQEGATRRWPLFLSSIPLSCGHTSLIACGEPRKNDPPAESPALLNPDRGRRALTPCLYPRPFGRQLAYFGMWDLGRGGPGLSEHHLDLVLDSVVGQRNKRLSRKQGSVHDDLGYPPLLESEDPFQARAVEPACSPCVPPSALISPADC